MPDRIAIARRIIHAMIQSVTHMHMHNVVHGDLNPSNLRTFELAVGPREGVATSDE